MATIRLLTEHQTAEILGVASATLRGWRSAGKPPRFIRVGTRAIRYDFEDLQEFIDAGRPDNLADAGEGGN